MLTIKDDSLRYYTISYAIFNQLSYLINSSGQMLSECLTVRCVWWEDSASVCEWRMGALTPVIGKRRGANLKHRTLKRHKIEKQEEQRKQRWTEVKNQWSCVCHTKK